MAQRVFQKKYGEPKTWLIKNPVLQIETRFHGITQEKMVCEVLEQYIKHKFKKKFRKMDFQIQELKENN